MELDRQFVQKYAKNYDDNEKPKYLEIENRVKSWLAQQKADKYYDKANFRDVCRWKSPRAIKHYEENDESEIVEVTTRAFDKLDDRLTIHILKVLKGVNIPVASTLLHFAYPGLYPIFDIRVRTSLKEFGLWKREVSDAGIEAWLDYLKIMRPLIKKLAVQMRELEKALWQYDKEK